jgi:hypothetical protein
VISPPITNIHTVMNEFDNVAERRGRPRNGASTKASTLPFWVMLVSRPAVHSRRAATSRSRHLRYSDSRPSWCTPPSHGLMPNWRAVRPNGWFDARRVTGANLACRAVGANGDSVMMNAGTTGLAVPGNAGVTRRSAGAERSAVEMDIAAMADALDKCTRLFMFCNPQNPTGRTTSATNWSSWRGSANDTIC